MSNCDDDDDDGSISTASIVGESGRYQILRIRVPLEQPSEPSKKSKRSARKNSKDDDEQRLKLGISLTMKEWLSEDLSKAFPGYTSKCEISAIKEEGLAAVNGVRRKDILCWPKPGCESPVVFHVLVPQIHDSSKTWELIDQTKFEEKISLAQDEEEFTFYVARLQGISSTERRRSLEVKNTSTTVKGISLSKEMVSKLVGFSRAKTSKQEELLAQVKEDAKKHFENDRDRMLNKLPDFITKKFFSLGFSKWRNAYVPVLLVNPFEIPPKSEARSLWISKFEKRKNNNTLGKMNHLVYWYGYGELDPAGMFSLVPQEQVLTWDEGVEKGLHLLPDHLTSKSLNKKRGRPSRSQFEREARILAHITVEKDVQKSPTERAISRFGDFKEIHDLVTIQDLLDFSKIVENNTSLDDSNLSFSPADVESSSKRIHIKVVSPVISEGSDAEKLDGGGSGNEQNHPSGSSDKLSDKVNINAQTTANSAQNEQKSDEVSPKLKKTVTPQSQESSIVQPSVQSKSGFRIRIASATDPTKHTVNNVTRVSIDGQSNDNVSADKVSAASNTEARSPGKRASARPSSPATLPPSTYDKDIDENFDCALRSAVEVRKTNHNLRLEYKNVLAQVNRWHNKLTEIRQWYENCPIWEENDKKVNNDEESEHFVLPSTAIQASALAIEEEIKAPTITTRTDSSSMRYFLEFGQYLGRLGKQNKELEEAVSGMKEKAALMKKKYDSYVQHMRESRKHLL